MVEVKGWLAFVTAELVGLALCLGLVVWLNADPIEALLIGLVFGSVWLYVSLIVRELER